MSSAIVLVIAAAAGVFLGLVIPFNVPAFMTPFFAVGILAACNTMFGGIAAWMKRCFRIKTFAAGFFFNTILAMLLTYAGTKIGVDFSLAAIVYFGVRIFNNFSRIQHYMLQKESRGVKINLIALNKASTDQTDVCRQTSLQDTDEKNTKDDI